MAGMKVGRIVKDFNLLPLQENIRPLLLGIKKNGLIIFILKSMLQLGTSFDPYPEYSSVIFLLLMVTT